MLCVNCNQRPIKYMTTGECHTCYQQRWRELNPGHNVRTGKRGEQKRRSDAARRARQQLEKRSGNGG